MNNTTKINLGVSLTILAFSLTISTAIAQTCGSQPTCENLGFVYKTAECPKQAKLKCPFDTSLVYCSAPTLTAKTCVAGDTVYSDGKCYAKTPPTLTVKGTVIDATYKKAFVKYMTTNPWYAIDTSKVITCRSSDPSTCISSGTHGSGNTQAIKDVANGVLPNIFQQSGYVASMNELNQIKSIKGLPPNGVCSSDIMIGGKIAAFNSSHTPIADQSNCIDHGNFAIMINY